MDDPVEHRRDPIRQRQHGSRHVHQRRHSSGVLAIRRAVKQTAPTKLNRSVSAAALGVLACATTVYGPPLAAAAPPESCGVNLASPQVIEAVRTLPPYPGTGWAWSTEPQSFEGNFNPCATLSTALVSVEGATGSSPVTALMFHNGTYLGTATSKAYGFTSLDPDRTTDNTVVLDYKTPGAVQRVRPRVDDKRARPVARRPRRHARPCTARLTTGRR